MTTAFSPLILDLADALADRPLVAILRATDAALFPAASNVLIDAGWRCLEYTLTTAGALDALRRGRIEHPEALLGAGSVRTADQAHAALDAGAQFLVGQVFDPGVATVAAQRAVPYAPGALTPTEIMRAWRSGAPLIKISPIGPVGGLRYFAELRGPMPEVPLMPTGGVLIDEVRDYLAAGAALVGLSRDLFRDSLSAGGDLTGLKDRAHAAMTMVCSQ